MNQYRSVSGTGAPGPQVRIRSGSLGRTAAAKTFDPEAIRLAVLARIRHAHTRYDDLLDGGWFRDQARDEVRDEIDAVASRWERR